MQITGHKELGANTIARRPSDFLTGVPIKKRKFPFIRPPSPPSQISSTTAEAEPVSEQKQQSNVKPDSSSSRAGSPTKVDGLSSFVPSGSQEENMESSAGRIITLVEGKTSQSESNLLEPTREGLLIFESEMCCKITTIPSSDTTVQKNAGSIELVAPNKSFVETAEKMRAENEPLMDGKPNLLEKSVDGELPLAINETSCPDKVVADSKGFCEEVKLDPCSWNLALTEGQSSSSNHNAESKINCPRVQTNRTHWDLNTMMDTWEGSISHSATVQEVGLDVKRDMKHAINSNKTILSEPEGSLITSGKQTFEQSEEGPKSSTLSASSDPETKNDIILNLSLSTFSGLKSSFNPEPSHISSSKVDTRSDLPNNLKISKNALSLPSNLNLGGSRIVKSEPSDESNKQDFQGASVSSLKSVKGKIVKTEPCVVHLQEHHKTSSVRNLNLITHGYVKTEPVCGINQESLRMPEDKSRNSGFYPHNAELPLSSQVLPVRDAPSCSVNLPITLQPLSCPTSLGLSNSADASFHTEVPVKTIVMPSAVAEANGSDALASESVSESVYTDFKELEGADDMSCTPRVDLNSLSPESSKMNPVKKLQSDSHGNQDGAGSDEEKINLFDDMQDDCSSDTDDESGGNHGVGVVMDTEGNHHGDEDDDYEDGELREPLVHSATEVCIGPDKEVEYAYHRRSDNGDVNVSGSADENASNLSHVQDKVVRLEDPGVTKICHGSGNFDDTLCGSKSDDCVSEPTCLREASTVELLSVGIGNVDIIKATHRGMLNCALKCAGIENDLEICEKELLDGAVSAGEGTSPGDDQGSSVSQHVNINGIKPEDTIFSAWSKAESPVIAAEPAKDVNSKGNQSRIINLARAFSGPSQSRMRSFSGRFLPSRIERERYNDGLRNGDKLHPRGSRDDGLIDGRNKFERQRNQDQPLVSNGSEFMHGRGRPDKRFDSPHAAVMVSRDGRKSLRDEVPNFRHPSSRRRSPGGRGRPVSHGVQIVRRSARDISPDRCIGRGDPNLIGLRSEKKFMRGLPDEMMDTAFSRSQPQYQHVDDHFVRGERSFSPIQRKGPLHIPRIRSRSPSGTRSPGPWSSPRRRSPDGFGRSELIHRRSPPFYRVKRMRSSHQRPVFSDDLDGRRRGSPPYISRISNEMREIGASREPDHPRSFIPSRSPSGRILARGTRRFDMIDPRERIENDDYFAGPMHSDRFHEIGADGGAEGRRICTDRRRSFRPPYDATEVEKFHFHVEGGPRPYRFSPEADAEFHERGNIREREFDRRVKNRSGNAPRRTRSVEEHEEYRNGDQGWDGAGFEDVSPAKRRRF